MDQQADVPSHSGLARNRDSLAGSVTAPGDHFAALDGLRGLAVILVFLTHFGEFGLDSRIAGGEASQIILHGLLKIGPSGVDLFFALSGFLIYRGVLSKRFQLQDYARKRLQRIYPTFLAVLALYVVLALARDDTGKLDSLGATMWQRAEYVALNVALLPLLPYTLNIKPIVTATWSLAYELLFYILVPLLVRGIRFQRQPVVMRAAVIAAITVVWQAVLIWSDGNARPLMFLCGMLVSELAQMSHPRLRSGIGFGALLLAMAVLASGLGQRFPAAELFVLFGTLMVCSLSPNTAENRWLSHRALRFLGTFSYSFYLIQGLTLKIYLLAVQAYLPNVPWILHLAPSVAVCLIVGYLLYVLVERPLSTHRPSVKHQAHTAR